MLKEEFKDIQKEYGFKRTNTAASKNNPFAHVKSKINIHNPRKSNKENITAGEISLQH